MFTIKFGSQVTFRPHGASCTRPGKVLSLGLREGILVEQRAFPAIRSHRGQLYEAREGASPGFATGKLSGTKSVPCILFPRDTAFHGFVQLAPGPSHARRGRSVPWVSLFPRVHSLPSRFPPRGLTTRLREAKVTAGKETRRYGT